MVTFPLPDGRFFVVDDEDFDLAKSRKWTISKSGRYVRHCECGPGRKLKWRYLHRLIAGDPVGLEVDHIDGNTLNNCRSNLRSATRSQNCVNTPRRKTASTGLRGAHFDRKRGDYHSDIRVDGRRIYLGRFKTAQQAHEAYVSAAKIHHGTFNPVARLA